MKKWAENLIETHRHPIVKLNTPGNKIYIPKSTEEEKALISKSIQTLANTLKFVRVERRCSRAKAVWLQDQKLARVIKATQIHNFVFQNKSGSYLHPEVALFLLETNRLEILWNNVPLSIQQGYSLLLGDVTPNLTQYKIYRTLSTHGYKILKNNPTKSADNGSLSPPVKKIKLELFNNFTSKNKDEKKEPTCKISSEEKNKHKFKNSEDSVFIHDIFERLANEGPKNYKQKFSSDQILYNMYISNKSSKKPPDFNIHLIKSKELLPTIGMLQGDIPNLFGVVTPDSVACYRFSKVNLPTLL